MSEKRFEFYSDEDLIGVLDTVTGRTFNSFEIVDLLNEQQATIDKLRVDIRATRTTIRKLQDLCGESDSENAKLRQEIKELKAQLREKEQDEQLYANEILELREANKEFIQFKELGGDY